MPSRPILAAAALALAALAAAPAWAAESAPVQSERATVSLVSETDAWQPGTAFRIGLRFRLAPGWHTYWRNPGDAGAPPDLALTLPPGATASGIAWPVPERMREGPLATYGYTGNLLLPVTVTPGQGGGPMTVRASAHWLVCANICVPEEGSFQLTLPQGAPTPSPQAALFAAADARTPRPSPFAARIAPDGTLTLADPALSPASVKAAEFFPDTPGLIEAAAPERLSVQPGGLSLALKPTADFKPGQTLSGVLTLRDAGGQPSFLSLSAEPGPAVPSAGGPGLLRILGLAFLGGLILNLMPCVFPVLAMKALAIARLSGAARGAVRAHAVSYTAGVLLAFGALGGGLLALRAAGAAAGWGFQFQSPVFVAGMAWLLFAIGLNLSGVYEFGRGIAGAGQSLAGRGGHLGSFGTGLLAVVVATPCTAPFMGAALAAAMLAPAPLAVGVFLALGLGLAAPYALFAVIPRLAGALPRPGRWMEVLRQALAFPMYGACVWLLWVVSQEAGPAGVLATASGLLLLGFAGWALGAAQRGAGSWRRFGGAAALAAALAALAVLPGIAASPQAAAAAVVQGGEKFSAERLASLRAEGRPVFVDMTAAWCVTCLVNERVALAPAQVRRAFAERGVAYLVGDWTRQDPAITAFLREFGRDGVPLYVFYPPQGEPVVLPQILTAGLVLRQIGG